MEGFSVFLGFNLFKVAGELKITPAFYLPGNWAGGRSGGSSSNWMALTSIRPDYYLVVAQAHAD